MKEEQAKLIKTATEYPTCRIWIDLLEECGSILDNFAKLCYQRMLIVYGKQSNETTVVLRKGDKSSFVHLVLSHSFMEFVQFTGLRLYSSNPPATTPMDGLNLIERPMYDRFCEVNEVPKELIEAGWKEYLED